MFTNAQYVSSKLIGDVVMIRVDINGITSFVPLDPANTDYQNIMKLVEDGELIIAPAEEAE
jgi:hypothetical protein